MAEASALAGPILHFPVLFPLATKFFLRGAVPPGANHPGWSALSPRNAKEEIMKKTLAVLATVAAVGVTAVAAPAQARGRGIGPGLAFGLAAGALTAGAIAASHPYGYGYYGPGYGYYDGPAYYDPGPYAYYGGPYYRHHRYYRYW
jgi:hypothetical protein